MIILFPAERIIYFSDDLSFNSSGSFQNIRKYISVFFHLIPKFHEVSIRV